MSSVSGGYRTVVVDPPWPIAKIKRRVRPNQVEMPYEVMTVAEIMQVDVPSMLAEDAHVFLWTTEKFLPISFEVLQGWGLKYKFQMVWHKPGGFQVCGYPQYNGEFVIVGSQGKPKFTSTKAFPVVFNAPRGAHSEKPEEFYDILRRVTEGPRLDMFNRRVIEGFDGWGKEAGTLPARDRKPAEGMLF